MWTTFALVGLLLAGDCMATKENYLHGLRNSQKEERTIMSEKHIENPFQVIMNAAKKAHRQAQESNEDNNCQTWEQIGSDLVGDEEDGSFGSSMALSNDGRRLVVGGFGTLYIYDMGTLDWSFPVDLSNKFSNAVSSVSITSDGQFIAVGEVNEDDMGKVLVFAHDTITGSWNQRGNTITEGSDGDQFGWDVDISEDGTRLVIGAPAAEIPYIRVGILFNNDWLSIRNEVAGVTLYGSSVALTADGELAAIGAPGGSGAVYIHDINNLSGGPIQILNGNESGDVRGVGFGATNSFSPDGKTLAVGTSRGDYVKVFRKSFRSEAFSELCEVLGPTNSTFGHSVGLSSDGERVAIASRGEDQMEGFLYRTGRKPKKITSISAESETSGEPIAISGNGEFIVIGQSQVDGDDTENIRVVRVYEKSFTTIFL